MTESRSNTSDLPASLTEEALSPAATGISLQSLIAQHLQQDAVAETAHHDSNESQKAIGFQSAWVSGESNYEQSAYGRANNSHAGRRLNATDTTWAAGIEHLLPTPLFRLRVTKERLVRERESLEIALAQAQQLQRLQPHVNHGPSSYNSPFYQRDTLTKTSAKPAAKPSTSQQRIRTLQERLLNIKRHETHVDYQLRQSMPPHQQWLFTLLDGLQGAQRQLEKWQQRLTQWVSLEAWIRKLDPTRLALSQTNQHLRDVEQLLSQQASNNSAEHPQSVSSETLIECITLYDRLTAEAEQLQTQLTQRPSWLKCIGQKLFGLG